MPLKPTEIGTRKGLALDFVDPHPDSIDIEDIAHCLSRIPRFCGHTLYKISVAQHCVLVAEQCPPEYKLEGLLHDAPEAYMMDCPRPLKNMLQPAWGEVEDRLYKVIAIKYGALPAIPKEVKTVDDRMLFTEKRDQQPYAPDWGWELEPYSHVNIAAWNEDVAYLNFMAAFNRYKRI